ncbi:hypothetical protein EDC04DRAFT_2805763 [Pisolithus marmoratus]|nr:hypothetical protein EDC04DRAFT_2805763 [Pisolithus marmoratus]
MICLHRSDERCSLTVTLVMGGPPILLRLRGSLREERYCNTGLLICPGRGDLPAATTMIGRPIMNTHFRRSQYLHTLRTRRADSTPSHMISRQYRFKDASLPETDLKGSRTAQQSRCLPCVHETYWNRLIFLAASYCTYLHGAYLRRKTLAVHSLRCLVSEALDYSQTVSLGWGSERNQCVWRQISGSQRGRRGDIVVRSPHAKTRGITSLTNPGSLGRFPRDIAAPGVEDSSFRTRLHGYIE